MHERSLVEVTVVRVLCDFHLHLCAGQMISINELQSEVMPCVLCCMVDFNMRVGES